MFNKNKDKNIDYDILSAEYEAVFHYALLLCRNEKDAEDITQDTFLKAMKSKKSFNANSSVYTWLCAIAKNLWIDKCRKAGREVNDENLFEFIQDDEKSLEDILIDKDLLMNIHRVIHTLDEPYKEVFSLRIFGELNFKDIANLFSKTESWERVTFHRAKGKITEELRKDGLI